jgi:uncharacterized protein YlaN (UPF0358 family)
LDRELDYRLWTYHHRLARVKAELDGLVKNNKDAKTPALSRTTDEIRQSLAVWYDELDAPKRPGYDEFRNSGLYALVTQAEQASKEQYDNRLPKYNDAKAALFTLRNLNEEMQDIRELVPLQMSVLKIDTLLKMPGLGEWYDKPGMNRVENPYESLAFELMDRYGSQAYILRLALIVWGCTTLWFAQYFYRRHRQQSLRLLGHPPAK